MDAPINEFKLLIADDSRVYRKLLENTFSLQQYSTVFAKTGSEAIDLFAEHKPDLVITDWMMPDVTGVELCKRLREGPKDFYSYIIILTGVSDKREISVGLSAGADDYLTKPFEPDELRARIVVGCRVIQFHRQLEAKSRLLENLALTDTLTGLANRRAIENWANTEFASAVRHKFSLCAIMSDLDHFKNLNDTFGHAAGDTVLQSFAEILKKNCRTSNLCGRVGGEEFLMVLTHSEVEGATVAVEHIQQDLAQQRFSFGTRNAVVTASFGIACIDRETHNLANLVLRADQALYSSKRSGRNRISVAPAAFPL
jgi:diguanylate cyclase (GGDEF)-like protein